LVGYVDASRLRLFRAPPVASRPTPFHRRRLCSCRSHARARRSDSSGNRWARVLFFRLILGEPGGHAEWLLVLNASLPAALPNRANWFSCRSSRGPSLEFDSLTGFTTSGRRYPYTRVFDWDTNRSTDHVRGKSVRR